MDSPPPSERHGHSRALASRRGPERSLVALQLALAAHQDGADSAAPASRRRGHRRSDAEAPAGRPASAPLRCRPARAMPARVAVNKEGAPCNGRTLVARPVRHGPPAAGRGPTPRCTSRARRGPPAVTAPRLVIQRSHRAATFCGPGLGSRGAERGWSSADSSQWQRAGRIRVIRTDGPAVWASGSTAAQPVPRRITSVCLQQRRGGCACGSSCHRSGGVTRQPSCGRRGARSARRSRHVLAVGDHRLRLPSTCSSRLAAAGVAGRRAPGCRAAG